MKRLIFSLKIIVLLCFLTGCEKELSTKGVSRITYYVTFDLTGGHLLLNPMGTPFADPGFKALEGIKDVSGTVIVSGTVDWNHVGLYDLTYSAVNSDGFPSSTTRSVAVYDPAAPSTDISGEYLSDVTRVSPARSFTDLNVTVTRIAPGFFRISDLLGGFYDQGANYRFGPAYALEGYLQLSADNTLTYISSYSSGFQDSANSLSNGIYNPATGALSWTVYYTSNNWAYNVTITSN